MGGRLLQPCRQLRILVSQDGADLFGHQACRSWQQGQAANLDLVDALKEFVGAIRGLVRIREQRHGTDHRTGFPVPGHWVRNRDGVPVAVHRVHVLRRRTWPAVLPDIVLVELDAVFGVENVETLGAGKLDDVVGLLSDGGQLVKEAVVD